MENTTAVFAIIDKYYWYIHMSGGLFPNQEETKVVGIYATEQQAKDELIAYIKNHNPDFDFDAKVKSYSYDGIVAYVEEAYSFADGQTNVENVEIVIKKFRLGETRMDVTDTFSSF